MKKIITLSLLFISLLVSSSVFSQVRKKTQTNTFKTRPSLVLKSKHIVKQKPTLANNSFKETNTILSPGVCQYVLPPIIGNLYLLDLFYFDSVFQYNYPVGNNEFGDLQKAQYYDFSANTGNNNYLNEVDIYFGDGYSDDSVYTTIVPIRVFDGTSGTPGSEIGHTNLTLGEIHDSLITGIYGGIVTVKFSNIAIPASKKVFISVDMSNLYRNFYTDSTSYGDYLGILSSFFDSTTVNTAWEQWSDNSWHPFTDTLGWGVKVSMAMVPYIGSNNNPCTQIVPVKMLSFTAQKYGSANKIIWQTTAEVNNKGFEVQHSSDGVNYTTIGYVYAQTSSSTYNFVDATPFSQTSYYRIKQLDINGNATYSKIVTVTRSNASNAGIIATYPNPARSAVNLVVNIPSASDASIFVSDATGKIIMTKKIQSVSNTNQTVQLNVSSLAKGSYFIRLEGNSENKISKFIKE